VSCTYNESISLLLFVLHAAGFYLEPDSSSHQEPSFCSGFLRSFKDLFVFRDHALSVWLL